MQMEDLKWLYTVAASIFIFIVIYLLNNFVLQNGSKQRLPPSPPSLPVIGHLHLLKTPLHRTFKSLSDNYGPVFGLKLGNQYTVVVSSPAAVEECFGRNDVVLADRPQLRSGMHFEYDNTTIGAANYGDHWRYVRRISNQEVFSVSRLNMFLSLRQDEVKSMIKSFFSVTRQGTMQKVEMKSRLYELTFNIVFRIVTGKRYSGEGVEDSAEAIEFRKMIPAILRLSAVSNPVNFLPFLRLIDFGGYERKMIKLKKREDAILQNFLDESKRKMEGGAAQSSMLANILPLHAESDSASLSDKTIKGLMVMLINAGTDTAAATLEWAMSLLLNNPEKLKKTRSQLDAVISPPGSRLVEEADLPKLTYLKAIVKETLRMYPVAPLLVPHYSSSECTIQGFRVPRGTMLFVNACAIHRDPEVWKDPLSFQPERFENVEDQSHAYKLIPFGMGRRSCPGASMAHKVVELALASLIQCFDWETEEVDMQASDDGPNMSKLIPLEAKCQPRNNVMHVLSTL